MARTTKKKTVKKTAAAKRPAAERRKQQSHGVPTAELPYRAQGMALRHAREARGLTVMQVVDHLREKALSKGRSDATIRTWESGRFSPPAHVLSALCRLYGCEPNDILGFEGAQRIVWFDTAIEHELLHNPRSYSATERRRMFAMLAFRLTTNMEQVLDDGSGHIDARIRAVEESLGLL